MVSRVYIRRGPALQGRSALRGAGMDALQSGWRNTMEKHEFEDVRLLRQIRPYNLLSFGPDTPSLDLENLNVLIGPNGSGKSNLIEALALMRATPVPSQAASDFDVPGVLRHGGGAAE